MLTSRTKRVVLEIGGAMLVVMALSASVHAQCASPPNTLANGQVSDATKLMGNFNHLTSCLNSGQLTVPPVSSLGVTGPGGGTVTIDNPTSSTPYTLSLPANNGLNGQFLTTDGTGHTSWQFAPTTAHPPLADGLPLGRPAASSMTWINQGTASYVEHTNGPITLTVPASGADQIRALGQAPPGAAPYTLTAKIDAMTWGANYSIAGLYVRDSAGKIITFDQVGSSGNPAVVQVAYFNSASSYNSAPRAYSTNGYRTFWLRIGNDGTNWNFYWSLNGADWTSIYSAPLTAFLGSTISSLGVFGNFNNSGYPSMQVSLWSFELVSGSGTNSSWQ